MLQWILGTRLNNIHEKRREETHGSKRLSLFPFKNKHMNWIPTKQQIQDDILDPG